MDNQSKNTMYLVWYHEGSWDTENTVELFVTKDKKVATIEKLK